MSNPAAVVALRFDSIDLQLEDFQIFLEIAHGLNEAAIVRGVDVTVPSRPGRIESNRVNDILAIGLEGIVCADESEPSYVERVASYRSNALTIRNLFRTNRERATLEADLEDGSTISIDARPMPGHVWNEHADHAHVTIELEGYDDWTEVGS